MLTLTNHEIEEIIDLVIFKLDQTHRKNMLVIPNFICIHKNEESFYGKNYEIISTEMLNNKIIAHLKFDELSEVSVLEIDLEDLKNYHNIWYGGIINRINDLFNDYIQEPPF